NYISQEHQGNMYELELNPRHNLGIILMFEDHENGWRAGLENYYIGTQRVDRNPFRSRTPSYWLTGALVEKTFGDVRIYINFENIFDVWQTRYDPTFIGDPFMTGNFRTLHVYAPLEGRAINGGVRVVM
ncbi:MAG TPA: TonB-dependent receptor, partial [Candidatus Kapabacteria bacterium]|nr:TonB-dependent receptor [Candidatus Kapabacteria bacterium]